MEERGESLSAKLLEIFKANSSFFVFLGIGVLFLLIGVGLLISEKSTPPEMTITTNQATASGTLKVDIGGAVLKPGVYEFSSGARVQDVIIQAGGLAASADRDYVAKNINLALKLIDGVKIYIPNKGEPVVSGSLININVAPESELDKLTGVGPVTAQKIIAGRPYSKTEDLVSKKVLGQSAFDKIKESITVY